MTLMSLADEYQENEFVALCSRIFGVKAAAAIGWFLCAAQFASTVIYTTVGRHLVILAWQFVGHILKTNRIVDLPYQQGTEGIINEYSSVAYKYRILTMIGIFIVILPIALLKKLSSLRYISGFILVVVFFTIGVSIFQTPSYFQAYKDNPEFVIEFLPGAFEMKWLKGMATIMLSYNCQITLFYVRAELKNRTSERMTKVLRNLIGVEFWFYLLISISGYFSLGKNLISPVYTLRRKICKLFIILAEDDPDTLMRVTQCYFFNCSNPTYSNYNVSFKSSDLLFLWF